MSDLKPCSEQCLRPPYEPCRPCQQGPLVKQARPKEETWSYAFGAALGLLLATFLAPIAFVAEFLITLGRRGRR